MSTLTKNLKLFKYDVVEDSILPFSITRALNNNWDKIDNFTEDITDKIQTSIQEAMPIGIGDPIITLNGILKENEIWLEGSTVSRITYAELFKIYGTTYGNGDGSTTFELPDFRNKTLWGSTSFGYVEAGLPNVTGNFYGYGNSLLGASGAFYVNDNMGNNGQWRQSLQSGGGAYRNIMFNVSRANIIYGSSDTVQPPAVRVRVKTRYQ